MHLLLSPKFDQLSRVLLSKSVFESEVVSDVTVAVLELIQCGLEHFDGALWRDGAVFRTGDRERIINTAWRILVSPHSKCTKSRVYRLISPASCCMVDTGLLASTETSIHLRQ